DRNGRKRVARIVGGRGLWVLTMRFEESCIEEERLVVGAVQKVNNARRHVSRGGCLRAKNLVVADRFRLGGNVLQPGEDRPVPRWTQRVENVLPVVVHAETAVRQAQHSVPVGALTRKQRSPAG